jgi:fibronectin type 3 domain-containing protein
MLFGGINSANSRVWRLIRHSLLFLSFGVFAAAGCKAKPHSVDLTWDAPVKSPVPVVGYNIYRSADEGFSYHILNSAPVQGTAFVDTLLQSGRTYLYVVKSVDAQGVESIPSNAIHVTIP